MINTFISCAPDDMDIELLGITGDPNAVPLGKLRDTEVDGRPIRHLPILVDHPSIRSRIPLSFRYTWLLKKWSKKVDLTGASLLFHRLETAWGVRHVDAQKLMFLHYHVDDQILNPKSEVTWSKVPWLYFALEKRILPKMDHLWSERSDGIDWWKKRYPILQDRADFLPTWAEDRVFYPFEKQRASELRNQLCKKAGLDPAKKLAFFAARFEGQKDPMLLIRSWKELQKIAPGTQLALAGAGSCEQEMRQFTTEAGLDSQIAFLGTLNQSAVAEWLNASDIFVLSSAFEGMALSMVEALASGVPVVTTRVGEAPRVITQPAHGRIVDDRTPESLAAAVAEVLTQERDPSACLLAADPYTPRKVLQPVYDSIRAHAQERSSS
jgi:glycosyltransferase involved in cell wall biosynthesis